MSNELTYHSAADTGSTVYAMLENVTGKLWNGSVFQDPVSGSWGDYDLPMSEQATSTGIFRADMPSVSAGAYSYVVRLQAGGSPAVGDLVLGGSGLFTWDGSAMVTAATLLLAARAEPGQGAPAVNASILAKIDYLFKSWRNKKTQDATNWKLYNNAGDTVDQKATVSDDGTTTKGEMGTGA